MDDNSEIPEIKAIAWEWIQDRMQVLKLYEQKGMPGRWVYPEYNPINDPIGKRVLDALQQDGKIGKFQWNRLSGGKIWNLLEIYLQHFLLSLVIIDIPNITKFTPEYKLTSSFVNSALLQSQFENYFKNLEKKVLICPSFTYTILIPCYKVYFPDGESEIKLDQQHRFLKISNLDYANIDPTFRNAPPYWGEETEADSAFEIITQISKRISTDSPYPENTRPQYPVEEFHKNVLSVWEFFLCYSPREYPTFTMSNQYFIELPPFSQMPYRFQRADTVRSSMGTEMPPPRGLLDLRSPDWRKIWQDNYENFFESHYKQSGNIVRGNPFRYALEILRILDNIHYSSAKNFLLVSTLEGLLFVKDIQKKLNKQSNQGKNFKSGPVADTFVSVCKDQKQEWIELIEPQYRKQNTKQSNYYDDVKAVLMTAYQIRNNIAHPEDIKPVDFKPDFLFQNESIGMAEYNILELLTKFLRFLVRIWVDKRIHNPQDWYTYLSSLFP